MQPLFQAYPNELHFQYHMASQHQFFGMHAPGSLFPDWYHDILLIGVFEPGLAQNAFHIPYFYSPTNNNYFWDVLPEIFTGQKLKEQPDAWVPFLKHNRIGLTDLVLQVNDADAAYPSHMLLLQDVTGQGLEQFDQIEWNTDAIIQKIRQNSLGAVLITNTVATPAVEQQIARIRQAANTEGVYFDRLLSPYIQAQENLLQTALPYPEFFASWFDAFSPVIKARVI